MIQNCVNFEVDLKKNWIDKWKTVLNGERGVTFRIIFKYLNIHESFPLPSKITRHSSPISFSNILIPTIFEFLYHIDYKKEGPASSINTLFVLTLSPPFRSRAKSVSYPAGFRNSRCQSGAQPSTDSKGVVSRHMPHASLPSRINSSLPSTVHPLPLSSLSAREAGPLLQPWQNASKRRGKISAPTLVPGRGCADRSRRLSLSAAPLPPRGFDGELSGLGAEAAANGAKADTTGGGKGPRRWTLTMRKERGSIERGFWGPMIETLLTILFFTACVISSSMD